jgi:hypothetical protein
MDSFPDSESTQQLSNRFTARQEILKIASLLSSSPPTTHIVVPTLLTIFLFLLFFNRQQFTKPYVPQDVNIIYRVVDQLVSISTPLYSELEPLSTGHSPDLERDP